MFFVAVRINASLEYQSVSIIQLFMLLIMIIFSLIFLIEESKLSDKKAFSLTIFTGLSCFL